MEIHTIFVEPANYTQDLICHIHQKRGISYSFLKSNSQASNNNLILATAKHVFDKNSWQLSGSKRQKKEDLNAKISLIMTKYSDVDLDLKMNKVLSSPDGSGILFLF